MSRRFGRPVRLMGRDWHAPIQAEVAHPERVGADRLLNALAAFRLTGGPAIVVDAGTAVTIDWVDSRGVFQGGAIAPGPTMLTEAMARHAEQLPHIVFGPTDKVVQKDTETAMRAGAYWGLVGMLRELIARMRDENGQDAAVLGTGGALPCVIDELPEIGAMRPLLTLEGLAWAAVQA